MRLSAGPPARPYAPRSLLGPLATLVLLFGLLGMHALGPLAAPIGMPGAHSAAAMAMAEPGAGGDVMVSAVVGQSHPSCAHEHCVATLRPTPQLSHPAQLAPASIPMSMPDPPKAARRGVNLRAPPQSVRLSFMSVSRT